jgi:hypothetical protein
MANNERKAFQHLAGDENPHFLEDGKRIYLELEAKYGSKDDIACDNILNGLCAALTCLIHANVAKDNRPVMLQIIHNILSKNI